MRLKTQFLTAAFLLAAVSETFGQGTFHNLNFENATFIPIPGDIYKRVQFAPAFPGWTAFVGTVQQTSTLSNNVFLDSSGMSIIDPGWSYPFGHFAGVIEGNFTAVLQAGFALDTFEPSDTTLVQSGQIPLGTESLQFRVYRDFGPSGSFAVTLCRPNLIADPSVNWHQLHAIRCRHPFLARPDYATGVHGLRRPTTSSE
jgi:hypothetical protein